MKPLSMHLFTTLAAATAAIVITAAAVSAQPQLETPRPSPEASVSQAIGVTEVSVAYFRPGVKGRKIWGELVPYNAIWRTGANALPTVSFQDNVTIEGRPLAAGTYGLLTLPAETAWTMIFSKDAKSWGTGNYSEAEDALRVTVKPRAAEMTERMEFEFSDLTDTSATMALRWEKLLVPVRIGVDTRTIVLDRAETDLLRGPGSFTWRSFHAAADYALSEKMRLDKAMTWIDESIDMEKNFTNLSTKGMIMAAVGKKKEGDAIIQEALPIASEGDLVGFGGDLLNLKQPADALKIFEFGIGKYPQSWRVARGVARSHRDMKNVPTSIRSYMAAIDLAPADQKEALKKEMDAANSVE